jgi:deoxycytidine triphosphate deaminase
MPSLAEKRVIERERLQALTPSEVDPHPSVHGVLLSDEIIYYAQSHQLVTPFNPDNLKPAGYELTVGDEYFLAGEFHSLGGATGSNKVTLPPFEVAVFKTAEVLCLPRYLIARWNIRVKHAYSGLLWVGGPQVDPGYVGHLFCPIYNLSDKPVTLELGEALALMDFVKTTPFDLTKSDQELKRYPRLPKRLILEDYRIDDLRSALFTRAGEKLAEFEESIKNLETRFVTFTQISFAIFALVIALVALASKTGAENMSLGASVWGALTVALSIAAFLVSIFSYVHWRVGRLVRERYGSVMANRALSAKRFLRQSWLFGIGISALLAIGGGGVAFFLSDPFFLSVRQQVVTKQELDALQSSTSVQLENLRRDFEKEIRTLRAPTKQVQ